MHKNKIPLLFVLLWPIAAVGFSFLIGADTLVSTLLFFGVPALYLSLINKRCVGMAAVFSIIFSIPFAIMLDYVMEVTRGWYIPVSVFDPYRILGYVTIEQLIWLFLYVYLVVMFYETFLDKRCTHKLFYPKLKYLVVILYIVFGTFIIIHLTRHEILEIDYFYLKFGIVLGLLPLLFALMRFPDMWGAFLVTGAYFFYLSFTYEITALMLGQWSFPAANQFIGFLEFGKVAFPFEEFFFWILLGAMAVLSYYRFFGEK